MYKYTETKMVFTPILFKILRYLKIINIKFSLVVCEEMTLGHSSGQAGQRQRASGHAHKLRRRTCRTGRCLMGEAV